MGVTARLLKQELLIHLDYGLPLGDVVVRYRGPYQGFGRRIPTPVEVDGIVRPALATIPPHERSVLERLRHRIKGIAWTHYQGPVGQ
jgi:hypothetical protein